MRTLFKHQQQALDQLPEGGGYLAFEQGLGKTLTAILYAQDAERVLVVCPAVAVGVWERELEEESQLAHIPQGTRSQKAAWIKDLNGDSGFLVLNYEALLEKNVELAIKAWDPDLIILDEAQKIKNPTAKRSKVLHRLGTRSRVLALSGTPVTKNLLDLYSQYKAIDPTIWDRISWTNFKAKYAVWGGYGGYELISYQNTDDLMERIAPLTIVCRKEDALDLPEKTHVRVPVRLRGQGWSDYRQMAKTGVLRDWTTTTPLDKALRLSQIAGMEKLHATAQWVGDLLEQGLQTVVYFRFRAEGRALEDILGVQALTGDTPIHERNRMVAEFQAGERQVFLSQITAGSTAITLTAASNMVYHSVSYAYEDWAQSQDRIHRIGQEDHCNYYYIEATGPEGGKLIDDLVLRSLDSKEEIAGLVTRNPDLLLPEGT